MLKVDDIKALAKTYGTPKLFLNTKKVENAYNLLSEALPGVKIFYALKPNNHESIIKQLGNLGSGFDICSNFEIDSVLKQKIPIQRCIHTHPVKKTEDIEYAYNKGIRVFVIDNKNELMKLKKYSPQIKLFIRLAVINSNCLTDLSSKFGIYSTQEALDLIIEAYKIGFKKFGLCFHTGSQNENPEIYINGINMCKDIIFNLQQKNISISTIDIGGGFPVRYNMENDDIYSYCKVFYNYLEELMDNGIEIICEPGRFLCAEVCFYSLRLLE